MKIEFRDFYGQQIEIHNNTSSGNIRFKVTTTESLNDLPNPEVPRIETDLSLDGEALDMLIATLTYLKKRDKQEKRA